MTESKRKRGVQGEHPFVTQVRLNELQRRYLLLLAAERGTSISEALRELVERSMRSRKIPVGEPPAEGATDDRPRWPITAVLAGLADDDVSELAERHASA